MPSGDAGAAIRRAAGFGIATSVVTVISSVVRSKVTAVVLGPEGLGQVAAVQQIAQLVFAPLSLATGAALVSAFARERGSPEASQRVYDTTATIVCAGAGVLGGVAVLIGVWTFGETDPALVSLTGIALLSVAAVQLQAIPTAAQRAREDLRGFAVVGIGSAIVTTFFVAVLTPLLGVAGPILAGLLAPLVVIAGFARTWHRGLPELRLLPSPAFDRTHLRATLGVGAASLVAAIAMQGALSVIRWTLLSQSGHESNGQFQAAWALANTYFGLVLSGIGVGLFPRYAAAEEKNLPNELKAGLDFVWQTAPPVILIAIAIRREAIHALYSEEFELAAQIVGWQMAGDLAKATSWLFSGVLAYRGHAKAFALTEGIGGGLLALCAVIFVPRFGPVGVGYGYVTAYLVHLAWSAWLTCRVFGVPTPWRRVGGTFAFTACIAMLLYVGERHPTANLPIGAAGLVMFLRSPLGSAVRHRSVAMAKRLHPERFFSSGE